MGNKIKQFNQSLLSTHVFLLLIAIFSFAMSTLFIWTQDDYWTVGMYDFSRAWDYSIGYGNGRYLGNFFVNWIMCRKLLDDIVRAVLIVISIACSAILIDSYRKRTLLVSSLLHIGVGVGMFSNAYSWGHGFYNYVPPVVILLLSLCLIKKFYSKKLSVKYTIGFSIILAITGFSQQLFSENTTTISLLISIITLFLVKRKKKNITLALTYFVASLSGTCVMFIMPKLMKVSDKMNFYRKITGISERISVIIENTQISISCISSLFAFSFILSLSLIILLNKSSIKRRFKLFSNVILIVHPLVSLVSFLFGINISILSAVTLLLFLPVSFFLLFKLTKKENKLLYTVTLILSVLSVLQLLFVKPIGPRCFYITNILLSIIALSVFNEAMCCLSIKSNNICSLLISFVVLGLYSTLFVVNAEARYIDEIRIEYADRQFSQGQTTLEIINVPNERWLHYPNSHNPFSFRYSDLTTTPIDVVYIDYDEYLQKNDTTQ